MRRETELGLLERFATLHEDRSTDLAPSAAWCDAAQYACPRHAERELEAMFRNGPVVVGLTPDAPRPGDWFTAEVAGFPALVVRGADGQLRGWANVCAHRGSRLADGRGTARRGFTCGFHAWSFERDTGALIGTPRDCGGFEQLVRAGAGNGRDGDGADGPAVGLTPVGVAEVAGIVFVQPVAPASPDETRAAAVERLGPAVEDLEAFDIAGYQRHDSHSFELACNYKLAMDTFCEAYHIFSLHPSTLEPEYFSAPALTECYGDTTLMVGVRKSVVDEWSRPEDERRLLRNATSQYMIPPNGMLSYQLDHFQLWTIDPVPGDPGRSSLRVTAYGPAPLDERWSRKLDKNLEILLRVTRTEDFPRCEETQAAMASGALRRLTFGRNEPALINYHRSVDRLTGSSCLQLVDPAAEGRRSALTTGSS
jgi:phenylpropionate dioxygenase-like ring-hydroxylating dioxygenase large terminal subunit